MSVSPEGLSKSNPFNLLLWSSESEITQST